MWIVTDKSVVLYHPKMKTFSTRIDLTELLNIRDGCIDEVKYHENKLFIAGTWQHLL